MKLGNNIIINDAEDVLYSYLDEKEFISDGKTVAARIVIVFKNRIDDAVFGFETKELAENVFNQLNVELIKEREKTK